MLYYERKLQKQGYNVVIGVDEAGRGPLAGPVVAAAVALEKISFKNRIDDSKKLTALQRENAYPEIIKQSIFGIGIISEKLIDRFNILVATRMAMEEAILDVLAKLKQAKERRIHVILDGNVKPEIKVPFTSIIKGDCKSKSIACASILAKVTRDRLMLLYDKVYPQYGFWHHKGYGTQAHIEILKTAGPCPIHRRSFEHV